MHTLYTQILEKFRIASLNYRAFEPRYLHFNAYFKYLENKTLSARHILNKAIIEAKNRGCLYDVEWCQRSKKSWFERRRSLSVYQDDSRESAVYMYILPRTRSNDSSISGY